MIMHAAGREASNLPKVNIVRHVRQLALSLLCISIFLSGQRGEAGTTIRVLSYNVHHCEGIDGQLDVARIARVIQATMPDLVALQEIDNRTERTQQVDQAAELAKLTGMYFCFGGNLKLTGGHYGNAILSRWPLVEVQNRKLPSLGDGEQRGVLTARVRLPEHAETLSFWATHLDHRRPDAERIASARLINEWLDQQATAQSVVLAGDLNARRESAPLKVFAERWQAAGDVELPTIPAENPRDQIDFVLCQPTNSWRVIEVSVINESVASDHRPILAILEWSATPHQTAGSAP
ncbi:MAG: endonuclease/exonuclease/phosphatase family protein [Planctomycetales bacterium]|nr:endonuclease/exonuclease/phosphatase family protein [Planctomycetales bacterium]